MRIALVVHDFTRSLGHGRYVFELATRFRRDHEVHVFANTIDRTDAEGIHFHRVPAVRANALATIASFTVPATLRVGTRWDIIHAQGACCLRFNVITAHICNAGWAEAQRSAHVARTWRQRIFEGVVTPFERATYRWSSRAEVIAISGSLRDELAQYYGRGDPMTVIHHGVDAEAFRPADDDRRRAIRMELGIPTDAVVALFVGDLRKGAATVLEVAARTDGVRFVLVSRSAPEPYVARAAALGVDDRVAFLPGTAAIANYYAMADMFVFPSPYDAFGMVIAEAMAAELPVVTAKTAGASELIINGESGFVVDSATDPGPIAAEVTRLASDPRLRQTIGAAARRVARQNSWDTVARRTMAVYERALATAR